MMSLVGYDSGSEGEDDNINEEAVSNESARVTSASAPPPVQKMSFPKGNNFKSFAFSKDDDDDALEDVDMEMSVTSNGMTSSAETAHLRFDSLLPKPKQTTAKFVEEDPVPPKKVYGDEDAIPKPPAHKSSFTSLLKEGIGLSGSHGSGKVRITIPSLKDFENDEEDEYRKKVIQPSQKGSGLFAILPEPKSSGIGFKPKQVQQKSTSAISTTTTTITTAFNGPTTAEPNTVSKFSASLVPQQVAQKRPLSPTSANQRLAQVRAKYMKQEIDIKVVSRKKDQLGQQAKVKKDQKNDSDEDDDEETSDFFSFNSAPAEEEVEASMETERIPSPVFFSADRMDTSNNPEENILPSASFDDYPNPSADPVQPHDDLMKYIQPNSKKAKRGGVPPSVVNIIDVSADDLKGASTDWIKAISDTSMIPPRAVKLPGGLMKRKHQITYLAAEAKAREEELQNQWAQNRHTKRQTQSKYGF